METLPLSEKSRAILEAIAKGHTYEQILIQDLAWTYHDIFQAAAEALASANTPPSSHPLKSYSLDDIRQDHPNAYAKWDEAQDQQLRELFHSGLAANQIAARMKRQPSAIRSRLTKLGLTAS